MPLGTFTARVRTALARGTSLDTLIPTWISEAARQIERNYTFQYMKRWLTLEADASSDYPHIISIAGYEFKRFFSLRYLGEDQRFHDLPKREPNYRATRIAGTPTSYWLDGVSNIVLDAIPEEDLELELHAHLYSTWGTEDSWDHWLLRNAPDLLRSMTLMMAAQDLRDPKMYETYKGKYLDAQTTINVGEEELQSQDAPKMEWQDPYNEFDPNYENSGQG